VKYLFYKQEIEELLNKFIPNKRYALNVSKHLPGTVDLASAKKKTKHSHWPGANQPNPRTVTFMSLNTASFYLCSPLFALPSLHTHLNFPEPYFLTTGMEL
jgi:hypothetical protein